MSSSILSIRSSSIEDVPLILEFIKSLALYEKLSHKVVATEDKLRETLFGKTPAAHVIIGEINGKAEGFALYFYSYSTFLGQKGLYLEDLYVNKQTRGHGLGKALIFHLAQKAYTEGCGRMDWSVLDWNTASIEFYESLGANAQSEWIGYRLDHSALKIISEK
ncbi:MAG: GNAT family N-acetyltransferase [Emcibacter sp.]|nr:GNAT family N-acetyltransferase [Emcibacter sp.]